MHILIIPSWYPVKSNPIAGIFFKEQAMALQRYGYKVTVAFPELSNVRKINKEFVKHEIISGIEDGIYTYRYTGHNYIPRRFSRIERLIYYKRLKKLYARIIEERGKPDIIHAHSFILAGWSTMKLSKLYNFPFVLTEHTSSIARNLLKDFQKKSLTDVLGSADQVIAVGPKLKEELYKYAKNDINIEIVPNIVDTEFFIPPLNPTKNDNFRIFSVANLTKNKGMDVLIKAFAKAFPKGDAELYIGGSGAERDNLEQLANELNVLDRMNFLGQLSRDEVKRQMQECDVFALASRYETFGVVYIEALACGKPVIGTACGGPESIINDKNGILVPVDDIESLANALIEMSKNFKHYNSKWIRENCVEKFSQQAVINQLSKIYEKII